MSPGDILSGRMLRCHGAGEMGKLGSNLHVDHIVMTSDFMIPLLQVSSPNVQEWQGDRIASVLIPPKSMYCDTNW